MVKPADVPEYLTHNTSKKHSPTVVPSVVAPGLLVLREHIRSEMESARVLRVWGMSSFIESVSLVDILSGIDEIKCMSVFFEKKK